MIQLHFNWKQLSMLAGVGFPRACFLIHEGTSKSPQIVDFLKAWVKQDHAKTAAGQLEIYLFAEKDSCEAIQP